MIKVFAKNVIPSSHFEHLHLSASSCFEIGILPELSYEGSYEGSYQGSYQGYSDKLSAPPSIFTSELVESLDLCSRRKIERSK